VSRTSAATFPRGFYRAFLSAATLVRMKALEPSTVTLASGLDPFSWLVEHRRNGLQQDRLQTKLNSVLKIFL
jgi:hypothetical protein